MNPVSRYAGVKTVKIYLGTENDGRDSQRVDLKVVQAREVEMQ